MTATLTAAPARAAAEAPLLLVPDVVQRQTLAFFEANPDEILTTDDIAEKFGAPRSAVHTSLAPAVDARLMKRERDKDGIYVYSRGSNLAPTRAKPSREFTLAERSLIAKVHGYMPAQQLLDILNERLRCDLGEDAQPYTLEQLQAVTRRFPAPAPTGGHDRASLRKILTQARRSGVLAKVNVQVIDDFAVVWGLNARQVMALKDTLLPAQGDEQ